MKEEMTNIDNQESENLTCRHKRKWIGTTSKSNPDDIIVQNVDNLCLSINYHTVKYSWTNSSRLKEKHMRRMVESYFKIRRFLKSHPSYVLDSVQKEIIRSAQTVIRLYFNEEI